MLKKKEKHERARATTHVHGQYMCLVICLLHANVVTAHGWRIAQTCAIRSVVCAFALMHLTNASSKGTRGRRTCIRLCRGVHSSTQPGRISAVITSCTHREQH